MTDENNKSWKFRRRNVVRLKLIVRDFSDLQPREVITILAILFGKSPFKFVKKIGGDIFKADGTQTKRSTMISTETRIGIKLEKLKTCPLIINLL